MTRFLPGVLLLSSAALALFACEREPDELLFMVGRVTHANGSPHVGTKVELLRNGSSQCALSLYESLWSGGFDGGTYSPFGHFEANDAGDFLFEVTHRDTRADDSEWSGPGCFTVVAAAGEARVSGLFQHPGEDLEFRDLPLVDAPPEVASGPEGMRVTGEAPDLSAYEAQSGGWSIYSGTELVWFTEERAAGGRLDSTIDPVLLEDFEPLAVRYVGTALWSSPSEAISLGGHFEYHLESAGPPVAFPGAGRVPVSRGASCLTLPVPDGGSCPLTDGRLARDAQGGESDGGPPAASAYESLDLDLGERLSFARVVIRGLLPSSPGTIHLEGSDDLSSWTRLATHEPRHFDDFNDESTRGLVEFRRAGGLFLDLRLEAPASARYVRIRGTPLPWPGQDPNSELGPLYFYGAREISLF